MDTVDRGQARSARTGAHQLVDVREAAPNAALLEPLRIYQTLEPGARRVVDRWLKGTPATSATPAALSTAISLAVIDIQGSVTVNVGGTRAEWPWVWYKAAPPHVRHRVDVELTDAYAGTVHTATERQLREAIERVLYTGSGGQTTPPRHQNPGAGWVIDHDVYLDDEPARFENLAAIFGPICGALSVVAAVAVVVVWWSTIIHMLTVAALVLVGGAGAAAVLLTVNHRRGNRRRGRCLGC